MIFISQFHGSFSSQFLPELLFIQSGRKARHSGAFTNFQKEAVVAVINATIISLLVYIYNFIRFGATATVTYSVSISLFAVVMFASIFGTLVPMTLEKLKVDPAIATGPFISITNDIIGMKFINLVFIMTDIECGVQ